jgi:hypothetical protein
MTNEDSPWPRDHRLFGYGKKRILAIEGAGTRSVIAIAFLERIEKLLAQFGGDVRLAERFDFVGGTSMSALVACSTALGYRADELKEIFNAIATPIFKRTIFDRLTGFRRARRKALDEELDALLGDRSLGSRDLMTGLCIVAKRLDTGRPWIVTNNPRAPYWEDPPDHGYIGSKNYRLCDLIRASIVSPETFDPEVLPLGMSLGPSDNIAGLFVDGGWSLNRNPSYIMLLISLLETYGLGWQTGPEHLSIISLGAGRVQNRLSAQEAMASNERTRSMNALRSLIEEGQISLLSQMQLLGDCPAPWQTHMELPVSSREGAFGRSLFRFVHYDVKINSVWLRENLGLSLTERDVARLQSSDDSDVLADLYQLGRLAATQQVKSEHLIV